MVKWCDEAASYVMVHGKLEATSQLSASRNEIAGRDTTQFLGNCNLTGNHFKALCKVGTEQSAVHTTRRVALAPGQPAATLREHTAPSASFAPLLTSLKGKITNKLHGLSPRANYTDRATCRRSDCQLLRIMGATWSA
jgi:hypothetical protein